MRALSHYNVRHFNWQEIARSKPRSQLNFVHITFIFPLTSRAAGAIIREDGYVIDPVQSRPCCAIFLPFGSQSGVIRPPRPLTIAESVSAIEPARFNSDHTDLNSLFLSRGGR